MAEFQEVAVRLITVPCRDPEQVINTYEDAIRYVLQDLQLCAVEYVTVIFLDAGGCPICHANIGRGNLDSACVSLAEIGRIALLCNAAGVICVHNHPSGNPEPSREDDAMAEKMKKALGLFDICLVDFVIAGKTYCSYQQEKRGVFGE